MTLAGTARASSHTSPTDQESLPHGRHQRWFRKSGRGRLASPPYRHRASRPDKGYFNSEEIAACDAAGIEVYVPKPAISNSRAQGRFDKDEFVYDRENDHYVCPAGQRLTRRMTVEEKGRTMHVYWASTCGDCPLKSDCTTGKQRRVRRWEHEDVLKRAQARLDSFPGAMQQRRRPQNIHSGPSRRGWVRHTSR